MPFKIEILQAEKYEQAAEEFLRSFGINSLADLPTMNPVQVEEFKLQAEEEVERALAESVD